MASAWSQLNPGERRKLAGTPARLREMMARKAITARGRNVAVAQALVAMTSAARTAMASRRPGSANAQHLSAARSLVRDRMSLLGRKPDEEEDVEDEQATSSPVATSGADPVMLQLPPSIAAQMRRRGGLSAMRHWAPRGALQVEREGLLEADPPAPIDTLSGADETPPKERSISIQFYRDGVGRYRGLAYVPLTLRDKVSGNPRRVIVAVELKATIEDEPTGVGADVASTVTQSIVAPLLDKVAAVLSHPLAALAASATVLIPGVGPAYLVSYAIGQSLVDFALRKARS